MSLSAFYKAFMRYLWLLVVACSSPKHDTPAPVVAPVHVVTPPPAGGVVAWQPIATPFLAAKLGGERNAPCAISRDGRIACWGRLSPDDDGPPELRAGVATPLELVGITDATSVVINWFWICVAQTTGPGGCFALRDDLGRAPPKFPSPPVELGTFEDTTCARMRDGHVACSDLDGKVTTIANLAGATRLTCAMRSCCAIVANGALACFGGQGSPSDLAITSATTASTPKIKLPPAAGIGITYDGGCVRTSAGATACWGDAKDHTRASGIRTLFGGDKLCVVAEPDGTIDCGDPEALAKQRDVVDATDTCAVHGDGSVACWGYNENGEIGDGHPLIVLAPVRVPVEDVKDLQVAHTEACAVRSNDDLWCWGELPPRSAGIATHLVPDQYNASCRVSSGQSMRCSTPRLGSWDTESEPLEGPGAPQTIRTLAVDRASSVCAIDEAGKIRCRFSLGEDGAPERWIVVSAPKKAVDIEPISVGFCAILEDATVGCFLDHRFDEDERSVAAMQSIKLELVRGVAGATQLATGSSIACAIAKDSRVLCWTAGKSDVTELSTLQGATSIAANEHHQCAVVRGEVWCWGMGDFGQLGDGTVTKRLDGQKAPVKAKLAFKAVKVGVGRESTCALDDQHHVWCWGGDTYGALGQGRPTSSREPLRVVGLGQNSL